MRDYTRLFPMPITETAAEKQKKLMNIKKAEICNKFLASHPNLTDEQEILIFRERFRAATPESFVKAIESFAKKFI